MPATRSRTENWRQSLQNVLERGGALEISLPGRGQLERSDKAPTPEAITPNLIWRVRVLAVFDGEIVVEQPSALGQAIEIRAGADLIGVMVIGQNRWMFRTQNLGPTRLPPPSGGRAQSALRLRMPDEVERCQRRNFYRVSTVGLNLPKVECFPLLDPASAAIAEADNRVRILDLFNAHISGRAVPDAPPLLPQVGPAFQASLVNIGGGGVGLVIDPNDRPRLDSERLYWLRVDLRPDIPEPVGVTARLKHTHYDSAQRVYAGMAFEFGFDPRHQPFIVELLTRYAAALQEQAGG